MFPAPFGTVPSFQILQKHTVHAGKSDMKCRLHVLLTKYQNKEIYDFSMSNLLSSMRYSNMRLSQCVSGMKQGEELGGGRGKSVSQLITKRTAQGRC